MRQILLSPSRRIFIGLARHATRQTAWLVAWLTAISLVTNLGFAQQSSVNPSPTPNPFAKQFSKAYERIASVPRGTQEKEIQTTSGTFVAPKTPTPPTARKLRKPTPKTYPNAPNSIYQLPPSLAPNLPTAQPNLGQSNQFVPSQPPATNQFQPVTIPSPTNQPQTTAPNTDQRVVAPSAPTAEKTMSPSIAWWKSLVTEPLRPNATPEKVETNSLVYNTLARSPRIRALSQNPLIREMQVSEAEADFDPVSFVRTQFQDRVDPVGDNLSVTDDGTAFLDDHIWTGDIGVRKKFQTGASYELSQALGFRNSNSAFFNPQDQGTATLALNVTQPLLRGRGVYYNRSQILIAQKSGAVAWNTFQGELQDEIQKTVEAYWRLYFDRSVYLQKKRNVLRAEGILETLQGRAGLDSLPSQIARAKSAVLSRKTELANARRDIRNSETELRRLTATQDWQSSQTIEMLPAELPVLEGPDYDFNQVITTALENRNEIKEAMQRAKIAAIQRDISVNDLLPELSFLVGTYVSTLQGDSQIGDAFVDQFAGGGVKPGYSVGLEFELPVYNRAARSRLTQRKLQLSKIKAEVDESMQNVVAESQISLRRVLSARETLAAATEAIIAAQMDLNQNAGRWESFALVEGDLAEGQTPTTILDQLLDSQERLTAAELVFAQAELELKTAETALQRTMGTLLIQRNVNLGKAYDGDQPSIIIE